MFKIKATFHRDLWVNMFWDCSLGWTKGMFESLYHVEMLIVHVREQLSPRITAVKNMRWSYSKLRKVSFLFHYLWFTVIDELKRSRSCFAFCSVQINHQRSEKQPVTFCHYNDIIMGTMVSQITSLAIVYSTVYSGTDERKHQSSASRAFVGVIHQWPVNSPHKGRVTWKMLPFDVVIMWCEYTTGLSLHMKIEWYAKLSYFDEISYIWKGR